MRTISRAWPLLFIVTCGITPALANNPPQPDGMFSILLIFPIVILGFRLAGAAYSEKERKRRRIRGLLFVIVVFFLLPGTEVALLPLLIMLIYGCGRAIQMAKRGSSNVRLLVGSAVFLWTIFAVGDYIVSLTIRSPRMANEAFAAATLRSLADAEGKFISDPSVHKNGQLYGSLDDLAANKLIDSHLEPVGNEYRGYRFTLYIAEGGKNFCASAIPFVYDRERVALLFIPGESWLRRLGIGGPRGTGVSSFAVDKSGVIRGTELHLANPPTFEEMQKWKPL